MKNQKSEKICPICSAKSFGELIDFGYIPLSDYFSLDPKIQPEKNKLGFKYCLGCGFICQKFPKKHDYVKDERKTKHLSFDYVSEIVEYFKEKTKPNELIMELGCNDGSFLDVLSRSGFDNLLGIEPSVICSDICKSKGYKIENVYFNKNESVRIKKKYGSMKVISCRHVLEHILNPGDFMDSIKSLLSDDGMIFIEVPNAERILYDLQAHDLWEEHHNHFTKQTLENFVIKNGFEVNKILIKPYASTKAILLWASNAKKNIQKNKKFSQTEISLCKNFKKNWEMFCDNLLNKIKKSKKPFVCIGASHPQINFLNFGGIGNYISKFIDDDPNKIGKYAFAPKPIPIISTEQFLKSKFSGTIIKTAFGYDNWMQKICKSVGKNVDIIEPYII